VHSHRDTFIMKLVVAAMTLSLLAVPVIAKGTGLEGPGAVTLFAVGDVADCSPNNPSLISVSSLNDEEIAEHRMSLDSLLPREPLDIEELIEDKPGIVLGLGTLLTPREPLNNTKDALKRCGGTWYHAPIPSSAIMRTCRGARATGSSGVAPPAA
jgi:hypothetical protein